MSGRLEGQEALQRRLRAIGNGRPLLATVQLETVREAKERVHRKTGHTARTIRPAGLTNTTAIVEAAGAAVFLEEGTRPHIIKPKSASVLAWPASSSGRRLSGRRRTNAGPLIFAKLVHHPGNKPFPFLLPGAIAALRKVGIEPIIRAWNKAA